MDRFVYWPEQGRYFCRKCDGTGDNISLVRELYNMSYIEACIFLEVEPNEHKPRDLFSTKRHDKRYLAPDINYEFSSAGKHLYMEMYKNRNEAHDQYLRNRGISDKIFKKYCFTNPSPIEYKGLNIPQGICIPIFWNKEMVGIKVRRDNPKEGLSPYTHVKGSTNFLHTVRDTNKRTCVLVEGELDALAIASHIDHDVYASCGNTSARHNGSLNVLATYKRVIISPDNDEAGETMVKWWSKMLPINSEIVQVPHPFKDPNEFVIEQPDKIKDHYQ